MLLWHVSKCCSNPYLYLVNNRNLYIAVTNPLPVLHQALALLLPLPVFSVSPLPPAGRIRVPFPPTDVRVCELSDTYAVLSWTEPDPRGRESLTYAVERVRVDLRPTHCSQLGSLRLALRGSCASAFVVLPSTAGLKVALALHTEPAGQINTAL